MSEAKPSQSVEEWQEKQAPVNVKLERPTETIENWGEIADEWKVLNTQAEGHPGFYALTIKGAYSIGVIHDICESVDCLLHHPQVRQTTYFPAYGVFASGVEVLGRCLNGNATTENNTKDLKIGFKWMASSSPASISDSHVLIQTSSYEYTVEMLTALRHFAAHGQATTKKAATARYKFGNIDFEILERLLPLLAEGLDRYWRELLHSELMCNKLAKANIIALRDWPVLKSWRLFEKDEHGVYQSIADIFKRFNWRVAP